MPRQAFFTYERDFSNKWCPVIYYDELPELKPCEKRQPLNKRDKVHEITDHVDDTGEVKKSFSQLTKLYPIPND